jgi:predicted RNA binding protein YcfA (HicA-like mRNA interferase family)
MKVREIIKQLEEEGWYLARQSGSHKIFKNKKKPDLRIVLPDHGNNREPSVGVLNEIKKKAGWK